MSTNYTITFHDEIEFFMATIYYMTKSINFDADHAKLTIALTGGY
jgi:hypothetical protein